MLCILHSHVDVHTMVIEELLEKIHDSGRKNSILERTWNELHDEVSKSEERI